MGADLIRGVAPNGDIISIKVDAFGNLSVVGAGVESGTQIQIVDGTDIGLKATVLANGRLLVDIEQDQPLTDAQLRATPVPVDVSDSQFNVGNFPADYPLPAGQIVTLTPQTNALTDAQLRASAVPVETELVQPLTDAQLRASAVGVSGPLTDAQLRALAVPVSGPLTDAQLRAAAVLIKETQPTVGTKTSVAVNAASVELLAANANRKGAIIYNNSLVTLYLDLSGGAASTASFSLTIPGGAAYELPTPVYTGAISGIWQSAGTGSARITEFT